MSLSAEKNALKTALETYGKNIDLEVVHGDITYTSKDVVSFIPSYEGSILTAVMKQAEIELEGVGGPDFAEAMKGEKLFVRLVVTHGEPESQETYVQCGIVEQVNGGIEAYVVHVTEEIMQGGLFLQQVSDNPNNSFVFAAYINESEYEADILGIEFPASVETAGVGEIDTSINFANILEAGMVVAFYTANGLLPVTYTTVEARKTATKDFGTYIVKDAEYKDETNSVLLSCYDLMLLSMTEYEPVVDFPKKEDAGDGAETTNETESIENSETTEEVDAVTLGYFLQIMCNEIGVVLATPTFVNSDVIIDEEKYDSSYTKRDVFTEIAQAAGGTIAIINDELYVLYPSESGVIIDPSNLKSIEIGELYGPVNSVVLARTPQEDNVFMVDETAENICEIKIENNQLMDSHREDFIEGIYNALYGLTYYPHDIESFGIGVLDICDLFTIETLDGNTYTALHLSGELEINQGLVERTMGAAPEATETEYKAASKSDRVLNKTILRVDKQEQKIQALVETTEQKTNDLTGQIENVTKKVEQTMTSEEVHILVSETLNGIDSVKTATGYTFDQDGLRINKSGEEMENLLDNTGMYVNQVDTDGNTTENILTANNEGVNAVNLTARKYLTIGTNSRLEDYADADGNVTRTACFYIGLEMDE